MTRIAGHLRHLALAATLAAFAGAACSDDPNTAPDTIEDAVADTDTDTGTDTAEIVYEVPDYVPNPETPADEVVGADDLSGPVRVVYDTRGIPHIYGESIGDLAYVQGYITARDRIFQMHTLRSAARGTLAQLSGSGALGGDLLLRMLKLRDAAEGMTDRIEANHPELWLALTRYADGVNRYLARLRAGEVQGGALEINIFGPEVLTDWTPVDTLVIVRLQTWDLGFGGQVDKLELLNKLMELRERFGETPLAGAVKDMADFRPAYQASSIEPEGGANTVGAYDLDAFFADSFVNTLKSDVAKRVIAPLKALDNIPHHAFRGDKVEFGSNNWLVSGAHTQSGKAIVANDTHLALRNPAVFYQVHLSNTLAGGDLNVAGVNFAGAPGIVLGHNDFGAWGGTVFYSDVTDFYIEQLNNAGDAVNFEGKSILLTRRPEVFRYPKSASQGCLDVAPTWVTNLPHEVVVEGGTCVLTVTFLDVPHHGPIIPWSFQDDKNGAPIAVSWKWTGFEPTDDLVAVWGLNRATDVSSFKSALDNFGVGAQNWIWGDVTGDIAWYPSHLLPVRKHIAAGDTTYPPFLPMPGHTGATEWDGFVPRSELPQVTNPASGYLVTANADPTGTTFDNDAFNDGVYLSPIWAPGYRLGRIQERLAETVAAGDVTVADMQAIQGDHRSNVGAQMSTALLEAIDAAESGADPSAAPLYNARMGEIRSLLAGWATRGHLAANGVGAANGSDEALDAAATAVFNSWLIFVIKDAIGDEGMDELGTSVTSRVMARLVSRPEEMNTFDPSLGDSLLWDNQDTPDTTETRAFIMVGALAKALDFLADTDAVGPRNAGGFGTTNIDEWRWGALHTITLRSNIAPNFSIPPSTSLPDGFPRHCDNFCVDASHPGLSDTDFRFSGGAAIRNVFELSSPPTFNGVIPGGQQEGPSQPHYADEMALWVANEAPRVPFAPADVVAAKERIIDFAPAP